MFSTFFSFGAHTTKHLYHSVQGVFRDRKCQRKGGGVGSTPLRSAPLIFFTTHTISLFFFLFSFFFLLHDMTSPALAEIYPTLSHRPPPLGEEVRKPPTVPFFLFLKTAIAPPPPAENQKNPGGEGGGRGGWGGWKVCLPQKVRWGEKGGKADTVFFFCCFRRLGSRGPTGGGCGSRGGGVDMFSSCVL